MTARLSSPANGSIGQSPVETAQKPLMAKGRQASAPKPHAARGVREPSGAMTQQKGCSAIGSRESMDTPSQPPVFGFLPRSP